MPLAPRTLYDNSGFTFRKDDNGDFIINPTYKYLTENPFTKNVEFNDSVGIRQNDLGFLKEFTSIERLSIVPINKVNISAVNFLRNLKSLNIARDVDQNIDFMSLPLIEECQIFWNNKIKNLDSLNSIFNLSLNNYKNINLKEFSNLTSLKKLALTKSTISSLEGIESLVNLRKLELVLLSKLTSLRGIETLENLIRLDLQNCPNIENLEPVSHLKNLELLGIHDLRELVSMKPLHDLKKLQTIYLSGNTNILDGDMTTLIGRKDSSFGTRKHYSHTANQIDKINGTIRPKQSWDW